MIKYFLRLSSFSALLLIFIRTIEHMKKLNENNRKILEPQINFDDDYEPKVFDGDVLEPLDDCVIHCNFRLATGPDRDC